MTLYFGHLFFHSVWFVCILLNITVTHNANISIVHVIYCFCSVMYWKFLRKHQSVHLKTNLLWIRTSSIMFTAYAYKYTVKLREYCYGFFISYVKSPIQALSLMIRNHLIRKDLLLIYSHFYQTLTHVLILSWWVFFMMLRCIWDMSSYPEHHSSPPR